MFWPVVRGSLAPSMAWTCLTNDRIWWAPFAFILWRAFTNHRDVEVRENRCELVWHFNI
jgi:hypothetical protein